MISFKVFVFCTLYYALLNLVYHVGIYFETAALKIVLIVKRKWNILFASMAIYEIS